MANALRYAPASADPSVLGELALAQVTLLAWLALVAQAEGLLAGGVAAVAGAVGARYLVQRLRRFMPAARQGRLLRDRARSDLLAELLLCWPLGTTLTVSRRAVPGAPALFGLYLHAALIGALLWAGFWPAAVAWAGGTLPVRYRAAT